jgi:hypothetical protein
LVEDFDGTGARVGEVSAVKDEVGGLVADVGEDGFERGAVAVDVGEDGDAHETQSLAVVSVEIDISR